MNPVVCDGTDQRLQLVGQGNHVCSERGQQHELSQGVGDGARAQEPIGKVVELESTGWRMSLAATFLRLSPPISAFLRLSHVFEAGGLSHHRVATDRPPESINPSFLSICKSSRSVRVAGRRQQPSQKYVPKTPFFSVAEHQKDLALPIREVVHGQSALAGGSRSGGTGPPGGRLAPRIRVPAARRPSTRPRSFVCPAPIARSVGPHVWQRSTVYVRMPLAGDPPEATVARDAS